MFVLVCVLYDDFKYGGLMSQEPWAITRLRNEISFIVSDTGGPDRTKELRDYQRQLRALTHPEKPKRARKLRENGPRP